MKGMKEGEKGLSTKEIRDEEKKKLSFFLFFPHFNGGVSYMIHSGHFPAADNKELREAEPKNGWRLSSVRTF